MKERATAIFPFAIAAILPLPGLVLAGARFADGEARDGAVMLGCALLGALIWVLAIS